MGIERYGLHDAVVTTEKVGFVYTANSIQDMRDFNDSRKGTEGLDWTNQHFTQFIGDYTIFPHGTHNDLPSMLRDVIYNNYIAPGLLKKKTSLLWGDGPKLFVDEIQEGTHTRTPVQDPEVEDWLESWGHIDYLLKQCVDFNYIEGTYTKFKRNRGARIGKPAIAELEHINADEARQAGIRPENIRKRPKPTHVIVNEWGFGSMAAPLEYDVYELFDFKNPFKNPQSVLYSNFPAFCVDFYALPDIWGSLEWIKRSTSVPLLIRALTKNAANIKYHIQSPSLYWDAKEAEIEEKCAQLGRKYEKQMLEDFRMDLLRQIADVLSGIENTGKFWHTVKIYDDSGTDLIEAGWSIDPIDQKIKDLVDAYLSIGKRGDYAVGAGLQVHPALGGITETGKSDSGSEQLYAMKGYLSTSTNLPEMIVCKAVNHAIKANWPDKKCRVGFCHQQPVREQDISESKRMINNV